MKTQKYMAFLLTSFSIIPLILVMTFSELNFGRNESENLQRNAENTAQMSAQNIDQFFSQRKMALDVASDLPDVKSLLALSNANNASAFSEIKRNDVISTFAAMTSKQTFQAAGNTRGNYVRRSSLINKNDMIIASDDSRLVGKPSFINIDMRTVPAYNFYVSPVRQEPDFIDGQKYFVIAVPVYSDGVYQGFIQSSIDMYYFDLISKQTFMETGNSIIFDQDGNIVQSNCKDDLGNTVSNIKQIPFDDQSYIKKFMNIDLHKNPSGLVQYKLHKNEKWGYYSALSGTGWVIASTVSQSELMNPFMMVLKIYAGVLLLFIIILFFISHWAAKRFSNPIRDMCAAFINVEQKDYSIRLPGGYKGEFADMASSFNHLIEKIQTDTDELKVNEARYELIMEETNQVIFEWDILQNHLYHTVHWTNKFGFSMAVENPGSQVPNIVPVHPNDRDSLSGFFTAALIGEQPKPIDVRMKTIDSQYIWCTVHMKVIYDENRKPFRAIGLISDTDHQKRIIQNLENISRTDLLTKVYNKVTTEVLIEEYLRNSPQNQHHGFVIIDIDNFKGINDTLGHGYGDVVLKNVAENIKDLFRLSDIVGRVGGDEFVILVKELPRDEHLKIKLNEICNIFHDAYTGENNEYKISASIGAAFYPNDGVNFTALYRHADIALYQAKRAGKDRYSLYSDESIKITS
jgi:diguanylate cyclase (GGDEF)-like protein